ncbi:hypothetical protein GCM10010345_29880 [Streptomyces canarius]|uniref:Uncharacterized protein n=1 Tax=Streptomyces canarius TaxID=285453 RepID=A0ABQ3CR76_9ACTN|nr:hypothetical protein GCM10010345_29880 [Streptomyces canarius]
MLFGVAGQVRGGLAGQQFGVARLAGAAQDEEETAAHGSPRRVRVALRLNACAFYARAINLRQGAAGARL